MFDGFFISGTDTNVGKTIVSCILVKKLNAIYHKPIQCGTNSKKLKDSDVVKKNCKDVRIIKESYFFKNPLSPNIASKIERKRISIKKILSIKKKKNAGKIIVEGAGGLQVPVNKKYLMSDLIYLFDLPLILVCRTQLGTINHTLLSLELLRKKKIKLFGIVFVGGENLETIQTIKYFGKRIMGEEINILARIPIKKKINEDQISLLTKYFKSV